MNKVLVLAGLITAATAPVAFATEDPNCPSVSDRHLGAQARVEQIAPTAAPAGASNGLPVTDADERPHKDTAVSPAVAATPAPRTHARKHPRAIEAGVPDSVLIGDTGTL